MVWNHVAAVLVFSSPFLWMGLWMALDPAPFLWFAGILVPVFRPSLRAVTDTSAEGNRKAGHAVIGRKHRRTVRWAGVVLVLFAITI